MTNHYTSIGDFVTSELHPQVQPFISVRPKLNYGLGITLSGFIVLPRHLPISKPHYGFVGTNGPSLSQKCYVRSSCTAEAPLCRSNLAPYPDRPHCWINLNLTGDCTGSWYVDIPWPSPANHGSRCKERFLLWETVHLRRPIDTCSNGMSRSMFYWR